MLVSYFGWLVVNDATYRRSAFESSSDRLDVSFSSVSVAMFAVVVVVAKEILKCSVGARLGFE